MKTAEARSDVAPVEQPEERAPDLFMDAWRAADNEPRQCKVPQIVRRDGSTLVLYYRPWITVDQHIALGKDEDGKPHNGDKPTLALRAVQELALTKDGKRAFPRVDWQDMRERMPGLLIFAIGEYLLSRIEMPSIEEANRD